MDRGGNEVEVKGPAGMGITGAGIRRNYRGCGGIS